MIAQMLLTLAASYAAIGLPFALVFLIGGVNSVDPAAKTAPWSFKLLIAPGVVAFWPLMLLRWKNSVRGANHS